MSSIFICHSSKDKSFVDKLATDLLRNDIRVWLDKWEIGVGDSIIGKINSGIANFQYMGIILSPNSIKSYWVDKELNAGFMKEMNGKRVVILPILIKPCDIPHLIREKKYADFTKDYNTGLKELLNKLKRSRPKKKTLKKDVNKDEFYDNNIFEKNFYNENFV